MKHSVKQLFDYEYQLVDDRPFISDEELNNKPAIGAVSSFDMVCDDINLFIKFRNKDGKDSEIMQLNPVAARALALNIMTSLNENGLAKDVIIQHEDLEKETITH